MNIQELYKVVNQEFPQHNYFHWICIETPIYIYTSGDVEDEAIDENVNYVTYEFLDRRIIWVNYEVGGGNAATLIYPFRQDESNSLLLGKRFMSFMAWRTSSPFIEISHAALPNDKGLVQKVYNEGKSLRHKDYFFRNINHHAYTNEHWIALAHYREAVSTSSPYHSFLSYWKILELGLKNDVALKAFINATLDGPLRSILSHWHTSGGPEGPDFSKRLFATRNKSAHILLKSKKSTVLENPDDPKIYLLTRIDSSVVMQLCNYLFNNTYL